MCGDCFLTTKEGAALGKWDRRLAGHSSTKRPRLVNCKRGRLQDWRLPGAAVPLPKPRAVRFGAEICDQP